MGTTTSAATNVTVNGTTALFYGDATFAAAGLPLTSSYTAVASDTNGRSATNTVNVNLATSVPFQYDANGNLTNDGLRNFAYDDENQLIKVWVPGQWSSVFTYDGKMRRRIRQEFTWTNSAWVQTNAVYYVYDGNLVIQERDLNNLPTTTYTRGNDLSGSLQGAGGIGGMLARSSQQYADDPLAGNAFYHADANGNITMLVNSSQAVVAKYLYDAFGNVLSASGLLANANRYQFSSKEKDLNSGLVYYLYRFCDPNLQRWLNEDPIGELGGINLYDFVANNPNSLIDPFGLMRKCDCAKLRAQIYRKALGLLKDLRKYDPIADASGGCPTGGGGVTKPGGHYIEIKQRQAGLKDDLARYVKECIKNNDDNNPSIPRFVDEMANRQIPVPFNPPPEWNKWIRPVPIDGLVINPYAGAFGLGGAAMGLGAGSEGEIITACSAFAF
jgi:RHS repeat-associated protein